MKFPWDEIGVFVDDNEIDYRCVDYEYEFDVEAYMAERLARRESVLLEEHLSECANKTKGSL